jgi:hypothetical protein
MYSLDPYLASGCVWSYTSIRCAMTEACTGLGPTLLVGAPLKEEEEEVEDTPSELER